MSDTYEQYVRDFDSLISKWRDAYVCAVHSYVGVKTSEGWRLLFGQILLEPSRGGISEKSFKFETEHITAGRFLRAVAKDYIDSVLTKAKAGQMDGVDNVISLVAEREGSFSTYFAPIYHPSISEGPRLPSLLIRGVSKHNLLAPVGDSREFDWEVRSADSPFDTLDELLVHCGLPTLMQMGDSTTLEIVARSPGAIGGASTISRGEAVIECRVASALDVGKLRLGYRIFQKDQLIERGSATGDTFQWHDENDLKIASFRIPAGKASYLQTFLSYDRITLHHWWITDPEKHLNPRHAIHQVFDQDIKILKKLLLEPEADKPYAFEGAVSTLLTLFGFSVSNYGRIPKLQEGPDIVAFTPSGHMGIIECTVGLLDKNDKLAKLVQRTTLIKEKLVGAGYGYLQLQPVIVTPLSRKEVAADLKSAGEHQIAVVCKEDIEAGLNQVRLPPNADKMFQDAKRLIPGSDQQSLFQRTT